MQQRKLMTTLVLMTLGVAACGQRAEQPVSIVTVPQVESPFRLTATIQDIMASQVDPAADFIWDSVSSTTTKKGTEDKQPRTDEEWKEVRHRAITLIEATNLLVMDGRKVAIDGAKSENPGIEEDPHEVQRLIAADRTTFIAFAHALGDAGADALEAIDARDAAALTKAGGHIDEVCEGCHLKFWYPKQKIPTPP